MKTARGFLTGVIITAILLGNFSFASGLLQNIPVAFNSVSMKVNGTVINADNILYNGTTYVPLRAIADMLGKEVGWDGATMTASINDKGFVPSPAVVQIQPTIITKTSRSNPATLGQTISVNRKDLFYGLESYDITLLETKSGADAWNMVFAGNQFNLEPRSGQEYLLAKFKIKVNSLEKSTISINQYMFDVVSGSGVKYEGFNSVSGLYPDWNTELYAGADFIGWTYFLVNTNDSNPVAAINRNDEQSAVWFKLRN